LDGCQRGSAGNAARRRETVRDRRFAAGTWFVTRKRQCFRSGRKVLHSVGRLFTAGSKFAGMAVHWVKDRKAGRLCPGTLRRLTLSGGCCGRTETEPDEGREADIRLSVRGWPDQVFETSLLKCCSAKTGIFRFAEDCRGRVGDVFGRTCRTEVSSETAFGEAAQIR
jgi:hypothetical protein